MKLPRFNLRDLFWLVLAAGLSLVWLYSHTSLKDRLAKAEARLSNFEAERVSFKEREEALAQKREVYLKLIKDVDIVKRKCESILDDYADLRNKPRLRGSPTPE